MLVKKLVILTCLIMISIAQAAVETKIVKILTPEKGESEYLLLASNGYVYGVDKDDEELVDIAYSAMEEGAIVNVNLSALSGLRKLLDQRSSVKSIVYVNNEVEKSLVNFDFALESTHRDPLDNYDMSVLADMSFAKRYFNTMQTATKWRSQCYNRAHVWTYELSTDYRINPGKMWLFFSAKYIKEYKYKWWFHVAPYIEVATEREPVVLDREFSRAPQLLTDWKNVYMKNNANCVKTHDYTTYEDNTWNEYCFLIKSSMYYWQPFNLENLTKEGTTKFGYDKNELRKAYSNAIKSRYRRDI
jgi:hypothetical protein